MSYVSNFKIKVFLSVTLSVPYYLFISHGSVAGDPGLTLLKTYIWWYSKAFSAVIPPVVQKQVSMYTRPLEW